MHAGTDRNEVWCWESLNYAKYQMDITDGTCLMHALYGGTHGTHECHVNCSVCDIQLRSGLRLNWSCGWLGLCPMSIVRIFHDENIMHFHWNRKFIHMTTISCLRCWRLNNSLRHLQVWDQWVSTRKTKVTPLLTHWSYVFLALTHQHWSYMYDFFAFWVLWNFKNH